MFCARRFLSLQKEAVEEHLKPFTKTPAGGEPAQLPPLHRRVPYFHKFDETRQRIRPLPERQGEVTHAKGFPLMAHSARMKTSLMESVLPIVMAPVLLISQTAEAILGALKLHWAVSVRPRFVATWLTVI